MPHLQFEINRNLNNEEKMPFSAEVRQLFSQIMDIGTDHICISIRVLNGTRAGGGLCRKSLAKALQ